MKTTSRYTSIELQSGVLTAAQAQAFVRGLLDFLILQEQRKLIAMWEASHQEKLTDIEERIGALRQQRDQLADLIKSFEKGPGQYEVKGSIELGRTNELKVA
ncbi:MAG TPA: hypothetical protein VFV37_01340 [Luteibaculaceae bacterium]|nr:hypothetical protein [Luteibaculaceae bacterium]